MNQVSLFEAWKLWLSGNLIHESVLWGINILWWGRIGKVVQLAAALTIIADILGPERLRSFGRSLHGAFTLQKADYYLRDALAHTKAMWHYLQTSGDEEKEALAATSKFKSDKINFLICLGITIFGMYLLWSCLAWWIIIPIAILGYCLLLVTVSPVITIFTLSVLAFIGLSIDVFIIEPIAWVIERQQIDRWIKIASVILLMLGFHFDLLAS